LAEAQQDPDQKLGIPLRNSRIWPMIHAGLIIAHAYRRPRAK
jgi:hypothetical protein